VKVVSPDTGTTLFFYGNPENPTMKKEDFGGAAERSTTYRYDGLDRITGILLDTDPDWLFTYDTDGAKYQKGRLASVTNGTVTTELEYTARGQIKLDATIYNGRRYDYDAAGNIVTITPPSGNVITYSYAGSRVSQVDVTSGSRTESIRDLEWLPFGPLDSAVFPPDSSPTSGTVSLTRDYNLRYQLEEVKVGTDTPTTLVHRSFKYDYTAGTPGPVDPGPNLDQVVDHLDASESRFYFYDELDRLARVTDLSGIDQYSFGYDAAGNRTSKTTAGGTTNYLYTPGTDLLAQATGAEAATYTNDAYGNRTYASDQNPANPTYVYNDQNRLIQAWGPNAYGAPSRYDAFGRRVSWTGWVFVYDQAGRILEVSAQGAPSFYGDLIWVEGELLGRVEDAVPVGVPAWVPPVTRDLVPRPGRRWLLVAGVAGTFMLLSIAVRRRSPRWAVASVAAVALVGIDIACIPQAKAFYWVVTDPVGKPIAMTSTPLSGAAQVVWKASYSPFGRAIESMDPDADGTSVATPVRFPGQWSDFATGLHYNFYRDYDPQTGRYLEPDPIGQFGGANLFMYARDNPLLFTDPSGTFPPLVGAILLGGGFGGVLGGLGEFLANVEAGCQDRDQFEGVLEAAVVGALLGGFSGGVGAAAEAAGLGVVGAAALGAVGSAASSAAAETSTGGSPGTIAGTSIGALVGGALVGPAGIVGGEFFGFALELLGGSVTGDFGSECGCEQ
jgi:RHS repeat-associated protein